MKHGLWHGHCDTTRHGHSDTANVKNIRHRHRYIFIKYISLELKIHTYASKLNKFFNKKSFKRIYDSTFDIYSSNYYQKTKNNVIKM
jgi:hypothetical protein